MTGHKELLGRERLSSRRRGGMMHQSEALIGGGGRRRRMQPGSHCLTSRGLEPINQLPAKSRFLTKKTPQKTRLLEQWLTVFTRLVAKTAVFKNRFRFTYKNRTCPRHEIREKREISARYHLKSSEHPLFPSPSHFHLASLRPLSLSLSVSLAAPALFKYGVGIFTCCVCERASESGARGAGAEICDGNHSGRL